MRVTSIRQVHNAACAACSRELLDNKSYDAACADCGAMLCDECGIGALHAEITLGEPGMDHPRAQCCYCNPNQPSCGDPHCEWCCRLNHPQVGSGPCGGSACDECPDYVEAREELEATS